MKIFVYGTLKRDHHNNYILDGKQFVEEKTVYGYKLLDAGFPVAMPEDNAYVKGEIWDIENDQVTLERLDRLEGNGHMYNRTDIGDDIHMYVGNKRFWSTMKLNEIPNVNGVYEYLRYRH